jgi:hypothetical protein
VLLPPKACKEWTNGYNTAFNVTCAFTPRSINGHCNGDNETFPGYIHSLAYDFGFDHGKKYPAGWAGDPMDCSTKYSYGGLGGKDSVLLKEYAQCIVGYNKGYSLPQSENDEIIVYDNKDRPHIVMKSIIVNSYCTSPHPDITEGCDMLPK